MRVLTLILIAGLLFSCQDEDLVLVEQSTAQSVTLAKLDNLAVNYTKEANLQKRQVAPVDSCDAEYFIFEHFVFNGYMDPIIYVFNDDNEKTKALFFGYLAETDLKVEQLGNLPWLDDLTNTQDPGYCGNCTYMAVGGDGFLDGYYALLDYMNWL